MGRLVRLVAASAALLLAVLAAGLIVGGSARAAAPRSADVAVKGCVGATGYPVRAGAMVMVSTTTPYSGQTIEVSGSGFAGHERVTVKIGGKVVARPVTDASGKFDVSVRVTEQPGHYVLSAVGATCGSASLGLTIRAGLGVEPISVHKPGAANGGTGGNGVSAQGAGSGLPFTGVDAALLIAVAVLLLGGGGYLVYAGRRRGTR